MKNLYTKPELKISVFGTENVVAASINPNSEEIKDRWNDFASITEVRFKDLRYVTE